MQNTQFTFERDEGQNSLAVLEFPSELKNSLHGRVKKGTETLESRSIERLNS
jgi:hypothetical protein